MQPTELPGTTSASTKLREAALDRLRDLIDADKYLILYTLVKRHPVEALDLLHQLDEQERRRQEQRQH